MGLNVGERNQKIYKYFGKMNFTNAKKRCEDYGGKIPLPETGFFEN